MQMFAFAAAALLVWATCASIQGYDDTRRAVARSGEPPQPQAMARQFRSGQSRALDDEANPGAP